MKIPENAKLVFKGVIFEVYQWEQEMYDGSVQTFERLKRPDTVVVFPVTEDKQVIILEQEQPGKPTYIGAAAGRVEEGEEIERAAARELLEETGYQASEFILLSKVVPTDKIDWIVYLYVARGCKKVAEPSLDPGEKIKSRLVSFEKFLEIALDVNFYDREIKLDIYRAKSDPKEMENLKKIFLE
ncbi:NUDIX hydrolase [Candidatus Daviesbacteria bacterium]|nr:NUDIX hydrolase [Candidatus Daviesbacteria bacterium]